jgi:hypothetical protein
MDRKFPLPNLSPLEMGQILSSTGMGEVSPIVKKTGGTNVEN